MTDNQTIPLAQGARGQANKYRERECPECGTRDWMSDEDEHCWRCERIKQGLPAVKPDPVHGYLFWNYQEQAWLPKPELWEDLRSPEWGKREEKQSV